MDKMETLFRLALRVHTDCTNAQRWAAGKTADGLYEQAAFNNGQAFGLSRIFAELTGRDDPHNVKLSDLADLVSDHHNRQATR
jgi:hypothetical protein